MKAVDAIVESAVEFLKHWKGAKENLGVRVSLEDIDKTMRLIWPEMSQEDGIRVLQRVNYQGGPIARVLP